MYKIHANSYNTYKCIVVYITRKLYNECKQMYTTHDGTWCHSGRFGALCPEGHSSNPTLADT